MTHELFTECERELIDAARMILSDGVRRLMGREGMFPTNRDRTRSARAEVIKAREGLVSHLVAEYGPLRHEVALAILIDPQGRLIAVKTFPQGKASRCEVSARILAGWIVESGATAVILAHNHPSGDSTPSKADVQLTDHYRTWLRPMDVELVDHLVITVSEASSITGVF